MSTDDELAAVTSALAREIEGGTVREVRGGDDLLVLRVRARGRTHSVGLSVLPGAAGPMSPAARPSSSRHAAWTRLRSALEGARVLRLVHVADGPGAWLEVAGEAGARAVLARFGRSPELALIEDGRVAASLHGRLAEGAAQPAPAEGPTREASAAEVDEWTRRLAQARHVRLRELRVAAARSALQRSLRAARRRLLARERDLERLGDGASLRHAAEALGAHLHELARGSSELVVADWGDPPATLRIPLDPAATAGENLRRAHAKASRAIRGREQTAVRIAEAREEVARLSDDLVRLEAAVAAGGDASDLEELLAEAPAASRAGTPQGRPPARQQRSLPYREYVSRDGLPVLVGRSGKGNDELTFRVARGNDLWLHARGVPGPHVVVRLPRGADPPAETLLDAATLAHAQSARGDEPRGEVTWCRVKHVRRRRGDPPGTVEVAHERVIALRVEPERLERLKRGAQGSSSASSHDSESR